MNQLPFNKPGKFWRGNLHTHSTCSDGSKTPEQVCAFYRSMGYNFLSITDHFMRQFEYPITDTTPFRTADFTTILGAELHAGHTSIGELWHVLAVGLPEDFAPNLPDEDGPAIARRAMDAGAFVACAHPNWYALSEKDVIALGNVHAIETINGISRDHNDRIDSWYMLDAMLNQGRRYFALTTDDAHFHDQHNDLLLGWTWVKSEALTPEAILAALKDGSYYSSSGPTIEDIQFSGRERVYIRCSPVDHIFVTGTGPRSVFHHANGVSEIELDLKRLGDSPFCRITLRDRLDQRAWTNPIWFED